MTDPNTLADEIVAYADTDDLAKLPTGDADKLRAAFWHSDYYDFTDIPGTRLVDAALLSRLRELQATAGTSSYETACYAMCGALLTHAHAMSDSLAEQALRDAYDRLHPDNSTETDDMRQRARDLRATA